MRTGEWGKTHLQSEYYSHRKYSPIKEVLGGEKSVRKQRKPKNDVCTAWPVCRVPPLQHICTYI